MQTREERCLVDILWFMHNLELFSLSFMQYCQILIKINLFVYLREKCRTSPSCALVYILLYLTMLFELRRLCVEVQTECELPQSEKNIIPEE
jgi:hypothetical protein